MLIWAADTVGIKTELTQLIPNISTDLPRSTHPSQTNASSGTGCRTLEHKCLEKHHTSWLEIEKGICISKLLYCASLVVWVYDLS